MYHSDRLITGDVFYILFCRIKSGGNLCQIDHDILHLGIVIQDYLVGFTSNAGLLISAKGGSLRDCIIGIYHMRPVSTPLATRRARLISLVHTAPPSPYSLSFAMAMTSSSVLNFRMQATGPKISS